MIVPPIQLNNVALLLLFMMQLQAHVYHAPLVAYNATPPTVVTLVSLPAYSTEQKIPKPVDMNAKETSVLLDKMVAMPAVVIQTKIPAWLVCLVTTITGLLMNVYRFQLKLYVLCSTDKLKAIILMCKQQDA